MIIIKISGIIRNTLVNGDGLRYALFVSGCPHKCVGCHNQQTWDYNYGKDMDIEDIFNDIKQEYPLITGVTFSGGEPFDKVDDLVKLAKKIKNELNLNIWCYTGYEYNYLKDSTKKELLKYIDVLVDGEFKINKQENALKFTGSNNQTIIHLKNGVPVKIDKAEKN